MGWRVFVDRRPWSFESALHIVLERPGGVRAQVLPFELQDIERNMASKPTVLLEENEIEDLLQAFTDAAWEQGIRPRQIEDQRSQVKAMEVNLSDLRRIAFKLLKIDASS